MRVSQMFLAAGMVLFCACSSSSSGSSANVNPADASTSATNSTTLTFASQGYTLQPGDEKYYCYTTTLQQDVVFNEFAPTYGDGTHHIVFAYTIAEEADGFFECPQLLKTTWVPMFVGGKGTTPLKLPSGAGMKLPKGQQVLLQLHLQNATQSVISGETSSITATSQDPSLPFEPAGIYGLFNEEISIPPAAVNYPEDMTCTSDKTMTVFAALAHMHKLGTHVTLSNATTNAVIYDANWLFDVQPTFPLALNVNPGDKFKLECQYQNNGTAAVGYGESSDDEMCGFVFYYTKYDGLDGCVQSASGNP